MMMCTIASLLALGACPAVIFAKGGSARIVDLYGLDLAEISMHCTA